jgi:hypothetical protein
LILCQNAEAFVTPILPSIGQSGERKWGRRREGGERKRDLGKRRGLGGKRERLRMREPREQRRKGEGEGSGIPVPGLVRLNPFSITLAPGELRPLSLGPWDCKMQKNGEREKQKRK